MASAPQKKSLIPRMTHDCNKLDLTKPKGKGSKLPVKTYSSGHPVLSLPHHDDGLIPEDEDAVRSSVAALEAEQARMKQSLEETVKEAEERLQAMQKLFEEREKLISTNAAVEAEKEKLAQKVTDQEKILIENNIDPITGLPVEVTADQTVAVGKIKKINKDDVAHMRERLHVLNENSDNYLTDVQKILREIEEVEATSIRVGGLKPEDALSPEEMAEVMKTLDEAQQKADAEQRKEGGESEEDSENNSSVEEANIVFVTQNPD